jgi:hypothetical protein
MSSCSARTIAKIRQSKLNPGCFGLSQIALAETFSLRQRFARQIANVNCRANGLRAVVLITLRQRPEKAQKTI